MIAKKLVLIEKDSKGYQVPLATRVYFKGLNPNLRVSCVAIGGKSKTGKSYLMNRLFLDASKIKFDLHHQNQKGTKGIEAVCLKDESDLLVLLDTQGIESTENREISNYQILAMCLSSIYIFNVDRVIDQECFKSLNFIHEIEGLKNGPHFIWLIRNFSLRLLNLEGNLMSDEEYLNYFINKSLSESASQIKQVITALQNKFLSRKCITLINPGADQQCSQQSFKQTKPQFEKKLQETRMYIANTICPKEIDGKEMVVQMFVGLCEHYCKIFNEDNKVQKSFTSILQKVNQSRTKGTQIKINQKLDETSKQPQFDIILQTPRSPNTIKSCSTEIRTMRQNVSELNFQKNNRNSETKINLGELSSRSNFQNRDINFQNCSQKFLSNKNKHEQPVEIQAVQIKQYQIEYETQLNEFKKRISTKIDTATSFQEQKQALKIQIALLQSQISFLVTQNRQKQVLIDSILQSKLQIQRKYSDLLSINKKLSQQLAKTEERFEQLLKSQKKSKFELKSFSPTRKMNIFINKVLVKQDTTGKPFLQYELQTYSQGKILTATHTFMQFTELHQMLSSLYPSKMSLMSMKFEKQIGRKVDINKRCMKFEQYLNSLQQIEQIRKCDIFLDFLTKDPQEQSDCVFSVQNKTPEKKAQRDHFSRAH